MRKLALLRILALTVALFLLPWNATCQSSLALSSTAAAPGSAVSLPLSLSSSGTAPVGLEWTLTYPAAASHISVAAGPALTAAGKTVACATTSGGYTCVASGMNSKAIANGVIATVSTTVSGSATINMGVNNALASSSAGSGLSVSATGSAIALTTTATVSTIGCNSTSLNPGASALCTVTLSSPAVAGGANVTLGVTGNISAPASLSIAAGASSGTFTATAGQFSSAQTATLTASLNGSSQTATLSLTVPAFLSALQCTAPTLVSNASTTCTVTLTTAAPSGGASVALSGSIAGVLAVPPSVTVPPSATTAAFTASTGSVPSNQSADITASWNGSSKTATLSLSASVMLSALQCTASTLASNASTTCTVTLTTAAPSGGASVALSGSIAGVLAVPSSVTVPASATTAAFTASTGSIPSNQSADITASWNGSSKTATLSLSASVMLSALQCTASTLASNASTTCTVTLTTAAPSGGVSVTLSGAIAGVLAVPSSVTVPASATTAIFTASTGSIPSNQSAIITASLNSSSKTAALALTAALSPQPTLSILGSPAEVNGVMNGSTVTPTVAPPGFTGTVVTTRGGSVNFAPDQYGNGVYFLNCCANNSNAYYKFTGTAVGSIFNFNQGQISFSLKSRYNLAQRASAVSYRAVLDVRDGNPSNHLISFTTQVAYGYLIFYYTVGGVIQYYYVPQGTEDTLFGSGVTLQVSMTWAGNNLKLALNGTVVKFSPYTPTVPNWTSASVFDLGAYEYLNYGGYDSCDDIISSFSVAAGTQN